MQTMMMPCTVSDKTGQYLAANCLLERPLDERALGKKCLTHGLPRYQPAYNPLPMRPPDQWVWGVPGMSAGQTTWVVLPWSEYHNLDEMARAAICASHEEAEDKSENHLDEIVGPLTAERARELKAAFDEKASADWTPNQSRDDQEENSSISNRASRIIRQIIFETRS